MEDVYLQILTIVGIIATLIGSGIGIFRAYYWYKDRMPYLDTFQRNKQTGAWKIFIHNPTKIIENCNVEFDGDKLLADNGRNNTRIGLGKGTYFTMPIDISDNDERFVTVKDGKKLLLKKKFAEMDTVR